MGLVSVTSQIEQATNPTLLLELNTGTRDTHFVGTFRAGMRVAGAFSEF